ncbi:MAG TPA: ABC transporter ATP-binding protein [Hyphomicrobiales bacterium]|nr:ABC transporter ATP-binding protein [Hyphomicrobiales bacterium]
MRDGAILKAEGIEAGYGSIQVLWGAGIFVPRGETVVLLGANGAGKTTLLKVLMGLVPAWNGAIIFDGQEITNVRTDRRVRAGMAYMSEIGCFPGLTIDENIRIGGQFMSQADLRRRLVQLYETFPALAGRRHALASSLSGGQRKMLGIAKALAGNPRLVVMDEPSSGLSPLLVKEVLGVLAEFARQGLSLLIAEQNVNFLKLASRVFILAGGRIGFEGTVDELHADDALQREYFGLK